MVGVHAKPRASTITQTKENRLSRRRTTAGVNDLLHLGQFQGKLDVFELPLGIDVTRVLG